MARKTMRNRGKKSMKIFRRVYSPVYHTVEAARGASKSIFRGSEKILNAGLGAIQGVGSGIAKHADEMIRNTFTRRRRNSARRAANTRRNRK